MEAAAVKAAAKTRAPSRAEPSRHGPVIEPAERARTWGGMFAASKGARAKASMRP
jgi:hypothetical protein